MTREPCHYQLRQQQVPSRQPQATHPQPKQARKQDPREGVRRVHQRNDGNPKPSPHRNLPQPVRYPHHRRRRLRLQCPCITFLRNVSQDLQPGNGKIRTDLSNFNSFTPENRLKISIRHGRITTDQPLFHPQNHSSQKTRITTTTHSSLHVIAKENEIHFIIPSHRAPAQSQQNQRIQ
jgi:hypothetical protein